MQYVYLYFLSSCRGRASMEAFRKLSWFFKEQKKDYIIGVFALFLVALLNLFPSRIVGIVVDEIATHQLTGASLSKWLLIVLVIGLVMYGLRYVWRMKIWGNASRVERIMRQNLYNHFTEMDATFFQTYRTGDLMAHATNDLNNVRMLAGGGILSLADIISIGLTTIIAMIFVVDWRLTVVAVIPLLLLTLVTGYIGSKLQARNIAANEAFSALNNKVQESIQGIKVIKSFGEETSDTDDFKQLSQQAVEKNEAVYRLDSLIRPAVNVISGLSYIIAIIYGGYLVMSNTITIGDFVTFINYIGMLIWPMMAVGQLFNIVERANASIDRIDRLMNEKSAVVEQKDALEKPIQGKLSYNVSHFSYPDSSQTALENIHFSLEAGKAVGVVGRTGSSKTTLFKLLLRAYDDYDGQISFDGIDIRDYSLTALLDNIGYVPQENFLFSTTVEENIKFANPDYSDERMYAAAKMADIHEDILQFPQAYQTKIGERGVALSGGQKQRVAIARALIKKPKLLILDDSLSAVDGKTEAEILRHLRQSPSQQALIIVAHRISSVMEADEILVMEDGRVVERGTHDDLIAKAGWYKQMFDQQQLQENFEGGVE